MIELTGRDYDELIEAMLEKHEPIKHHFFSKSWPWLQKLDSDIAEKVMIDLIENHDEVILPIHDSFIVRIDTNKKPYDILFSSMEKAFKEMLGKGPRIDRNTNEISGSTEEIMSKLREVVKNYQETHKGFIRRNKEWNDI